MSDATDNAPWPWWTITFTLGLLLLNSPLFVVGWPTEWMNALEWNTWAVRHGEAWRLVTSSLIHFDARHLFFDLASFAIAGWLSERYFRRSYGLFILWLAIGVGIAAIFCVDQHTRARGLSGVNAGMYAALLWAEIARARREPSRWSWVLAASVLYLVWLFYGALTGRSVLAGDGQTAVWAHFAGLITALAFLGLRAFHRS